MKLIWDGNELSHAIISKNELSQEDKNKIEKIFGKIGNIRVQIESYQVLKEAKKLDKIINFLKEKVLNELDDSETYYIINDKNEILQKDGDFSKNTSPFKARLFYTRYDAQVKLTKLIKKNKGNTLKYKIKVNI